MGAGQELVRTHRGEPVPRSTARSVETDREHRQSEEGGERRSPGQCQCEVVVGRTEGVPRPSRASCSGEGPLPVWHVRGTEPLAGPDLSNFRPVSYTHLTLPTK